MKVAFVFGTRPEAIKLFKLITLFDENSENKSFVISTGQQDEILNTTLDSLGLRVDVDLGLMTKNQSLSTLTSKLFVELEKVFLNILPDIVFIHGDTTTSMVTGIISKYFRATVVHVEAGLRTHDLDNPWPEEINRRINTISADYHMAPTEQSYFNLLNEGIKARSILVTGNTGIDTLRHFIENTDVKLKAEKYLSSILPNHSSLRKIIIITLHRRENSENFENILSAVKEIANNNPEILFLYPVHLNPSIYSKAHLILGGIDNVKLVEPINYLDFISIIRLASFVISDSGGIQEECSYLGIPLVLCRKKTERPEAIEAGNIIVAGVDKSQIVEICNKLVNSPEFFSEHAKPSKVFGDGKASIKIYQWLMEKFIDKGAIRIIK